MVLPGPDLDMLDPFPFYWCARRGMGGVEVSCPSHKCRDIDLKLLHLTGTII
jgi:hypothetical protein